MEPTDLAALLSLMLRLCGAGICVQSFEVLVHRRELSAGGLFGWMDRRNGTLFRRWLAAMDNHPGCAWLLGVRATLAAFCVVLPYELAATFWVCAALVVLQLYYNRRFVILAGNSETMFLVGLFAACAGALPGADARLRAVALGFVAVQASLAYLVAGLHKLGARAWRTGCRLQQIAEDGSYEWPRFARLVATRDGARATSWLVIGLELALPFAFLLPTPYFGLLLGGGLLFHTLVAVIMGLHGFWWSFVAAYPAFVAAHAWAWSASR